MPGLRRGLEGKGRVKVTEMIKVFLFYFEIFHQGISLAIGNLANINIYGRFVSTARVQCWPRSSDCQMRKDKLGRWYEE